MTTLIKNGTIITATDMYKADLMVKNGVITEIGSEISKIASEIIDAADKWVLPGAVDAHTHMDAQCDGMTTVDDFETGTTAAAAGGTTTILDYAEQTPGDSLAKTLEEWKAKADTRSVIDYGFHLALSEINEEVLSQIPGAVEAGVTSFHVRLDGYASRYVRDGDLLEFLQRTTNAGALACVHAENGEVIDLFVRRLTAEGRTSAKYLPAARPPEVEAQATARAISLAEMAKTPLYLANLSSAHAVEKVKAARDRGLPVFAGTCSHYLAMSSDRYEDTEGIKYYCTPPLRPSWHEDVLWKAAASGDIHVVGSDHLAFNYAGQKNLGKDNFTQAPRGFPGIQERLPVLYTAGVHYGKISANRLVDLTSTYPAKLFGLFPRKGTLVVGSDADMVIFDPKTDATLSKSLSLSRSDYTPYEGMRTRGAVWLVIQRGKVIAREGKVMGKPGQGEFLSREKLRIP
ncbi:MAG: dihydropyrimidinase [Acidobacteria bacterium]|nr:dihydropyrimidinase [Acidobacteriota bacterium]